MKTTHHRVSEIFTSSQRLPFLSVLLVFLMVTITLYFCDGDGGDMGQEEFQSDSAAVDVFEEESQGDSVTSASLKEKIHSGRKVLLNFCYRCDCKLTKPILQAAIEKCTVPVTMITIDADVVKIENIDDIMKRGVLLTPAVFIDGKKYSEGKMVKADKIKEWIQQRLDEGEKP